MSKCDPRCSVTNPCNTFYEESETCVWCGKPKNTYDHKVFPSVKYDYKESHE